jgi:hypothetical protein
LPYLSTIPVAVGGTYGQITYNGGGLPAGSPNLTFDNTTGILSVSAASITNNIDLASINNAFYPQMFGTSGQVLVISSDYPNTLYWGTPPAAGSDTQVVFNQSGELGGSSNITFDYSSGTLSVSAVSVTNNINLSSISFLRTYGSIGIDVTKNLQISASNNVVISPGVGLSGLFVSNIESVASATPEGFYRLLYNPATGQIVYATDLSP